jgi:hypothetical protein
VSDVSKPKHTAHRAADLLDSLGAGVYALARTLESAVQVIFRHAKDALRWCIAVQMQLLRVDWSQELLQADPGNAGVVRASAVSSLWPSQPLVEVPDVVKCFASATGPEEVRSLEFRYSLHFDCLHVSQHISWPAPVEVRGQDTAVHR